MVAEIDDAAYLSRLDVVYYFFERSDVSVDIREDRYLLHISSSFRRRIPGLLLPGGDRADRNAQKPVGRCGQSPARLVRA